MYVISSTMLWKVFIVLLATAVASEDEFEEDHSTNCMSLVHRECEPGKTRSDDFPRNEEELEEFCKIMSNYFECTNRVASTCEGEDNGYARYLMDLTANVRRVCDEDGILRAAVVENLPCLQDNWDEIQICDAAFNMDRQSYRDSLTEFLNEIGDINVAEDESQSSGCLNVLFGTGCSAATAGELCGDTAKNVIINVIQGMNTLFEVCPPGLKEHLPEIAEMMQAEVKKVESLEESLKKKK